MINQLKPPYERHIKQVWLVGTYVRVTKLREPCLHDVPDERLTAEGIITKVFIRFARTPDMRAVVYCVDLYTELLSELVWSVCPGCDTMKLELLDDTNR